MAESHFLYSFGAGMMLNIRSRMLVATKQHSNQSTSHGGDCRAEVIPTASSPAVCCQELRQRVCITDGCGVDGWSGGGEHAAARSYRTVLSVSRSQSLGRGRVQEEAGASCCSSSGTRARLSPLKDIAGSTKEGKKEYQLQKNLPKLRFGPKTA